MKDLPPLYKLPYSPTTLDWEKHSMSRIERLEDACLHLIEIIIASQVDDHTRQRAVDIYKQSMKK